jgi:hypothetical protein
VGVIDLLAFPGRPDEFNLALFIHVLSALVLIGSVGFSLFALAGVWRGGADAWRLAYRAIVWVTIPAWFAMRISAQWLLSEEGLEDAELEWIDIGFATSEPSLILLIIAGVIARVKSRRDGGAAGWGGRIATGLVSTALIAFLFALWAMTTKPV